MPFEIHTLEGRHLVLAYAAVFLLQGGYLAYVLTQWRSLKPAPDKKITGAS